MAPLYRRIVVGALLVLSCAVFAIAFFRSTGLKETGYVASIAIGTLAAMIPLTAAALLHGWSWCKTLGVQLLAGATVMIAGIVAAFLTVSGNEPIVGGSTGFVSLSGITMFMAAFVGMIVWVFGSMMDGEDPSGYGYIPRERW